MSLIRDYVKVLVAEAPRRRRYWGRAGAGIVFLCPQEGTILLGKRADWVADPGTWGAPGGSVDGGWRTTPIDDPVTEETVFKDTALRETEEECGSLPRGMRFVGRTDFYDEGFTYVTYLVHLTPAAAAAWEPTTADGETDEWSWFPLEELPSPIHPKLLPSLRRLGVL